MRRTAIIGVTALVLLTLAFALMISKRFSGEQLTPAQLHLRQPAPPEEPCAELERAVATESTSGQVKKTLRTKAPLSADENAIYRALLDRQSSGGRLNVSSKTFPLDLDSINCECFKGMEVESVIAASHTYRFLTRNVLPAAYVRLVDPKAQAAPVRSNDPEEGIRRGESVATALKNAFGSGLFSLSEIAFDKGHTHAVVSYAFRCGSLCGHGATVVFENVNGTWRETNRTCGGFIS